MYRDVYLRHRSHRIGKPAEAAARWIPAALAALVSAWPVARASAQAASDRIPAAFAGEVDSSVQPGDDFFAYANGGWLRHTEIPAGLDRWTARSEIDALTDRQMRQLLDDAGTAPPG
ncbi:MAG TPA: hypothetical protein VHR43_11380, partial [Gemmatimonadales bacterium]|nr:hypothetical protein [Gemmatimonadales bacterium]